METKLHNVQYIQGLDDLEFTQGATGHQTNIGQDNGIDSLILG